SGRYSRERVPPERLGEIVSRVRRGEWDGLSVTLPHKEAIRPLVDELDFGAARIGACNCVLRLDSGRLAGFNTDGAGFRQALRFSAGGDLPGAPVVFHRSGGAPPSAAVEMAFADAREMSLSH